MREVTVKLPSGDESGMTFRARFMRVKSSNGELRIRGTGIDVLMSAGQRITFPPETGFQIANEGGATVTAVLLLGQEGEDFDDPLIVGDVTLTAATVLNSIADVSVAATSAGTVLAANTARSHALISNLLANAVAFRIGGAGTGAAQGRELLPGESIRIDSTAEIRAYNPSAGALSLSVVEALV